MKWLLKLILKRRYAKSTTRIKFLKDEAAEDDKPFRRWLNANEEWVDNKYASYRNKLWAKHKAKLKDMSEEKLAAFKSFSDQDVANLWSTALDEHELDDDEFGKLKACSNGFAKAVQADHKLLHHLSTGKTQNPVLVALDTHTKALFGAPQPDAQA